MIILSIITKEIDFNCDIPEEIIKLKKKCDKNYKVYKRLFQLTAESADSLKIWSHFEFF